MCDSPRVAAYGTWRVTESPTTELPVYIGPEIMMPLASALAAMTGVVLMFGRRVVGIARVTVQSVTRTFSRLLSR